MSFRPATKDFKQSIQLTSLALVGGVDSTFGADRPLHLDLWVAGGVNIRKNLSLHGNLQGESTTVIYVGKIVSTNATVNNITVDTLLPLGNTNTITVDGNLKLSSGSWLTANTACIDDVITGSIREKWAGNGITVIGNVDSTGYDYTLRNLTADNATINSKIIFGGPILIGNTVTTGSGTTSLAVGHSASVSGTGTVALGYQANTLADFTIAIGGYSKSQGLNGIAIGKSAYAKPTSSDAIVIGQNASSGNSNSVVLGKNAASTYDDAIVLGTNASGYAIAIGKGADSSAFRALALGEYSISSASYAVAIGPFANAAATATVAIGKHAETSYSVFSVAIGPGPSAGDGAKAGHTGVVSIGTRSVADASYCVALGGYARSRGTNGIAIGKSAYATSASNDAIVIGRSATSGHDNTVVIGRQALSTYDDAIVLGRNASGYAIAIGKGANSSAFRALALGEYSISSASYAVAVGPFANAASTAVIAIGKHAEASYGVFSVAIGSGPSPGTGALASYTGAIAVGFNSEASAQDTIAIGTDATASVRDQIALGNPSPTSTTTTATAWGQTFQSRAWDDTFTQFATIDGTGNLVKGTPSGGTLNIQSNLDMFCKNIGNVDTVTLDTLTPKTGTEVVVTGNVSVQGGKLQVGNSLQNSLQVTTLDDTPITVEIIGFDSAGQYAHLDVFVTASSGADVRNAYAFRNGFAYSNGSATLVDPIKSVLLNNDTEMDANVVSSVNSIQVMISGDASNSIVWDINTHLISNNL